jgi:hypothetical protein
VSFFLAANVKRETEKTGMFVMRKLVIIITGIIALLSVNVFAQLKVDVNSFGRKIQLDGFLLEWKTQNALTWGKNDQKWNWGIITTPEGLSGYFLSKGNVKCRNWFFTIDPGKADPVSITIPDSAHHSSYYAIDDKFSEGSGGLTVEWVIPWDSIGIDTLGAYAVKLSAVNNCGDTLDPLLITGKKEKAPGVFSSALISRILLAGALLSVLIVLRIRIRNRTARKR